MSSMASIATASCTCLWVPLWARRPRGAAAHGIIEFGENIPLKYSSREHLHVSIRPPPPPKPHELKSAEIEKLIVKLRRLHREHVLEAVLGICLEATPKRATFCRVAIIARPVF